MRGLRGRAAIVTGASSGIGSEIAKRLASEGCIVGIFDINLEKGTKVSDQISAEGGRAHCYKTDITVRENVNSSLAAFEKDHGSPQILVNNAGWDLPIPFVETDRAFWDKVIDINFYGPLNMHHAVLPRMIEAGKGRVINIASDAGRVGSSGEAVYSACKGGIIAFSKTLARESARSGVQINCVCPGPTDTPLFEEFKTASGDGARIAEGLARAIPMKRIGVPEDYAGIVAFLASDDASYITGQTISVSGGLTMSG
jgi:2-hydroxycyclohexanecarboxyl-CoA dehydrogenase